MGSQGVEVQTEALEGTTAALDSGEKGSARSELNTVLFMTYNIFHVN